jgi:hypothetical protein
MLETSATLPEGALIDTGRDTFAAALRAGEAIWFEGRADQFTEGGDSGSAWRSRAGVDAVPTNANKQGIDRVPWCDHAGLRCQTGVHCGLVAPEVARDAHHFSMAVIYLPDPEASAQTLLTVNTGYRGGDRKKGNYLFLSDDGAQYTLKDTKGSVSLEMPATAPPDRPRMLIATLSGGRLALQENRNAIAQIKGVPPDMTGMADLFIGCRSHRSGLQKTLGSSVILDVLFWPQHTLLLPRVTADQAQHAAIHQHFLWGY